MQRVSVGLHAEHVHLWQYSQFLVNAEPGRWGKVCVGSACVELGLTLDVRRYTIHGLFIWRSSRLFNMTLQRALFSPNFSLNV